MCLLCVLPAGVTPDARELELAAANNPDGFGYAIITSNGNLLIKRSMDADTIISGFFRDRKKHLGPAIWHARIGTTGTKDITNCHPFVVGGDGRTVLAHNGTLFRPPKDEPRSDTNIFASKVMPVHYRSVDRAPVRLQLERLLGPNKVALLTTNRRYRRPYYIFNERLGEWTEFGAWMSNMSYRVVKRRYTGGSSSYWSREKDGQMLRSYDNGKTWHPAPAPTVFGAKDKGTRYGWCRWCKTPQVVEPYTKVCTSCHVCSECGEWRRACSCDLAPVLA
jgi:Glutamine amidotransferases class-II